MQHCKKSYRKELLLFFGPKTLRSRASKKQCFIFPHIWPCLRDWKLCSQYFDLFVYVATKFNSFWGQVTQLDLTIKEHRSELQQKVITLEHALNQARYELSERAVEVNNTRNKSLFIVIINRTVTSIRKVLSQKRWSSEDSWKSNH